MKIATVFAALAVALVACQSQVDDSGSGDEEGSAAALSRGACTTKADEAKSKKVTSCKADQAKAVTAQADCVEAANMNFDAFKASIEAAAPADADIKAALQQCVDSQACAAREAVAKATGKPVSQIESTGWKCTVAEWFSSLTSSCGSIDATDVGSDEYQKLVKQLPQKKAELEASLKKCHNTLDMANAANRQCTKAADGTRDSVYSACRAECATTKGAACIPEGESVACGVSGDKREGLLWADKGCVCKATSVCSDYKKLDASLKSAAEKDGIRCEVTVNGQRTLGIFRPAIKNDKDGAPTSVEKVCEPVPAVTEISDAGAP